MSKNSKLSGKRGPEKPKPVPAIPQIQVVINVFADANGKLSGVNVNGFPGDFNQAMEVMSQATRAIGLHFIQGAVENRYTKDGKVKDSPIIVKPNLSLH